MRPRTSTPVVRRLCGAVLALTLLGTSACTGDGSGSDPDSSVDLSGGHGAQEQTDSGDGSTTETLFVSQEIEQTEVTPLNRRVDAGPEVVIVSERSNSSWAKVYTADSVEPFDIETPKLEDGHAPWNVYGPQKLDVASPVAVSASHVGLADSFIMAEEFELNLRTWDRSGMVDQTWDLPLADDVAGVSGVGLFGDVAIVTMTVETSGTDQVLRRQGIDTQTGEVVWEQEVPPVELGADDECDSRPATIGLAAREFDVSPDGHAIVGMPDSVDVIDPATGEVEQSFDVALCTAEELHPVGSYPVHRFGGRDGTLFDTRSGEVVLPDSVSVLVDQTEDLAIASYLSVGWGSSQVVEGKPLLEVVDLRTGETIREESGDHLVEEDWDVLEVVGMYEGKVWEMEREVITLVDARTGEVDPRPVQLEGYRVSMGVPLAAGENWVILGNHDGDMHQILRGPAGRPTLDDIVELSYVFCGQFPPEPAHDRLRCD